MGLLIIVGTLVGGYMLAGGLGLLLAMIIVILCLR